MTNDNTSADAGSTVEDAYAPLGLAMLLREATAGRDLGPLGDALVQYIDRTGDAYAWLDLSLVLQMRQQKDLAMAAQDQALAQRRLFRLADAGDAGRALRLLVLKAPGDLMTNTPFECLVEHAGFQVEVMYVTADDAEDLSLPEHDVLLVAACASDANAPVLECIAALTSASAVAVINRPERIGTTERDVAYALLHDAPGIVMAPTARVMRSDMEAADGALPDALSARGIRFPLIVRPVGSHAGKGLVRVDDAEGLRAYLASAEAEELYVASFIDYSSADGLFRKYRIVLIQGQPFLCHMGISEDWMVHYPYAEMFAHPERRDEEASAMVEFDQAFAARHAQAFAEVAQRTGLDYVGFDCAETADGRLLIFEIATGMVVHDMDDPETFPYKQGNMQRVFEAFCGMLRRAAGSVS